MHRSLSALAATILAATALAATALAASAHATGPATTLSHRDTPDQALFLRGAVEVGDELLFVTDTFTETFGVQAWRSDGTAAGTRPILDGGPLALDPQLRQIADGVAIGDVVLFMGFSHDLGWQPWQSDLTVAGTHPLGDFLPWSPLEREATAVGTVGEALLFTAWDGHVERLWVSDGSRAGTRAIGPGGFFRSLARLGDERVLLERATDDGEVEVWVSDGTQGGTFRLADTAAATVPAAGAGEMAYFVVQDPGGAALWITDGTGGGTRPLISGLTDLASRITSLVAWQGRLWLTVADSAESERVLSVSPAGDLREEPALAAGRFPRLVAALAGVLLLEAHDATGAPPTARLYAYDGDERVELPAGEPVSEALGLDGHWLFRRGGAEDEVWITDGTVAGTGRWSTAAGKVVAVGDRVFQIGTAGLLVGPPEVLGAVHRADLARRVGSQPALLTSWRGQDLVWWSATQPMGLWLSAVEPTFLFGPFGPELSYDLYDVLGYGDHVLTLGGEDGAGTLALRDSSVEPVREVCAGEGRFERHGPRALVLCEDGMEVWITDATSAGTELLARIRPDWQPHDCSGPGCQIDSSLFFPREVVDLPPATVWSAAPDFEVSQLWRGDGTVAGTFPLRDFVTGDDFAGTSSDASPRETTRVGNEAFFVAFDAAAGGWGLWASNGTAAGTRLLQAFGGNGLAPPIHHLSALDRQLLFFERDRDRDVLWVSNGTPAGTRRVRTLAHQGNPAAVGRAIAVDEPAAPRRGETATVGGRLYFVASSLATGEELWISDGTAAGTRLLGDLVPGPGGSSPDALTAVGEVVLFSALGEDTGRELWSIVDRHPSLLQDLAPGPLSSAPHDFTPVGDAVFFVAATAESAGEVWAIPDLADVVDTSTDCSGPAHCFQDGRFRVTVTWDDGTDTGTAQPVPGASDDSGLFTFFSAENWEMLVKVLDGGCGLVDPLFPRYWWVFAAAATHVGYEIVVTDLETGAVRRYVKPYGPPAPALTDTAAFACSP